MSELRLPLINKLPELLVTPERYGKLALTLALLPGERIEMPLPELARVYDFPTGDSEL